MAPNNPDDGMDVSDAQSANVLLNIPLVFVALDVLMVLNKSDGMDVMPVPLNVLLNITLVSVELDVLMVLNKFASMDVMPVPLNVPPNI